MVLMWFLLQFVVGSAHFDPRLTGLDTDPPSVTCDSVEFVNQHYVEVMDWPALNMNPKEHVWDQMSIWVRDMDPPRSNLAKLHQAAGQAFARQKW